MCKLLVALGLRGLGRVHTQIKGLGGQGWVRDGFSCGCVGRVGVVVKDDQTDSDALFTHSLARKNKS